MVESVHPLLATDNDRGEVECWLARWRESGPTSIAKHFEYPSAASPLLKEVWYRANAVPGPRLLVDGVWFTRPYGGVTRVWEQILSAWRLPHMLHVQAPVACLDRDSHLALTQSLELIDAPRLDPLDSQALVASEAMNSELAAAWSADVFLSSWTTSLSQLSSPCSQLALVHDCLPERTPSASPELLSARRRWLLSAQKHLAVSAATARDLEQLLSKPLGTVPWCHPTYFDVDSQPVDTFVTHESIWHDFASAADVQSPFVLLPGTSLIGSYKNPELVARALVLPGLQSVRLVISGLNASAYASAIEAEWPSLASRILAVGCTDLQLSQLYRHALAVIMPSRVEGFGLPVIEALRNAATVLIADAPGLREAGSGAALRFNPDEPEDLARWLRVLLDDASACWLAPHLERRRQQRIADLPSADLLGLSLLALARQLWLKSGVKTQPCL